MLARGGFSHRSDFLSTGVGYPNPGLPPKKPCHSVRGNVHSVHVPAAKAVPKRVGVTPDPLFLFYCGARWHRTADTAAGWVLVQMRSADLASRALAAELLAEIENGRLLVRIQWIFPSGNLSRRGHPVCGRADDARSLYSLLGQGQAFHHLEGRQSSVFENGAENWDSAPRWL
jgi:hypothetical protein